jgi:protein SCO1
MNNSVPVKQGLSIKLIVAIALGVVVIGAVVGWVLVSVLKPYTFHGMVLQSPQPSANFILMAHNGQPFNLKDFRGQVVLIYFGYTTCPDVCPTTLAELKKARDLLGTQGKDVQVVMITVDPERDTPRVLADYMTHFDPSFLGLYGTPDETAQVATRFGIFYEKNKVDSALGYLVDHTATVMALDREGYLRVVFPFGMSAGEIADDVEYLLRR